MSRPVSEPTPARRRRATIPDSVLDELRDGVRRRCADGTDGAPAARRARRAPRAVERRRADRVRPARSLAGRRRSHRRIRPSPTAHRRPARIAEPDAAASRAERPSRAAGRRPDERATAPTAPADGGDAADTDAPATTADAGGTRRRRSAAPPWPPPVPAAARSTIVIGGDDLPDAVYLDDGRRGSPDASCTAAIRPAARETIVIGDELEATGAFDAVAAAVALDGPARARPAHRRQARRRPQAAGVGRGGRCVVVLLVVGGARRVRVVAVRRRATSTCRVQRTPVYTDPAQLQAIIDELMGEPMLLVDTRALERAARADPVDRARVRHHRLPPPGADRRPRARAARHVPGHRRPVPGHRPRRAGARRARRPARSTTC